MYTILVSDDHELITTQRERIMQRSKLVDKLHFLVPPNYDNLDMSITTVCMEYKTPVGHEYKSETLVMSEELYKDHLEFIVPFDTNFTRESGNLEVQLTFTCAIMDADGNVKQYVRKTSPTNITIIPIAAWADVIPDSALTALDQRLIKQDMQMQQMLDINEALANSTIDGFAVGEDGKLYGTVAGEIPVDFVGVDVVVPRTADDDGRNDGLIELGDVNHDDNDPNCDCGYDHDNFEELDSFVAGSNQDDENGNFSEL